VLVYTSKETLLIAETVHFTAIRALPGDMVAGHAPYVFLHAGLTDFETAAATPAKRMNPATAMTLLSGGSSPAALAFFFLAVIHVETALACRSTASVLVKSRCRSSIIVRPYAGRK
jgi:hypothetical protein